MTNNNKKQLDSSSLPPYYCFIMRINQHPDETPQEMTARLNRNTYMRDYTARKRKAKKALARRKAKAKRTSSAGGKGLPPKSAIFDDNFNPIKTIEPSRSDIREAQEILSLDDAEEILGLDDRDELAVSQAMLDDMRHVYKTMGGRTKLYELIQGNDAQFLNMIKELIKVETSLLTAKMRKGISGDGGNGRQNFFVVLKGLDDPTAILDDPNTDSADIDYKQIEHALNPHSVHDSTYEEDVLGKDAAPEQLVGSVLDEEAIKDGEGALTFDDILGEGEEAWL